MSDVNLSLKGTAGQHARYVPRDANGLEELIRGQFPLVFGDAELVPTEKFLLAYKDVADYVAKSAEPPFKSETHKQQATLAVAAIGLIAIILFKVGEVKIGDAKVFVDETVLVWYGVVLAVMLVVFWLRAFLDFARAKLGMERDSDKLNVLSDAVQLSFVRKNIQYYYWLKLFDGIGAHYDAYQQAQAQSGTAAPSSHIPMQVVELDLPALKKIDELKEEIASHDEFVNSMLREIAVDVERFGNRVLEVDDADAGKAGKGAQSWSRYATLDGLFNKLLAPWFDARNALSSVSLSAALDKATMRESKMLDAQIALLKKALRIRRLYAFTELVLPTILAIGAIAYVCYTR
jgi:hypothetical protein